MQILRSMGMPAHLHYVPGSTKRGQCRPTIDLELPRTTGNAYSLSCAWEKLWQGTGPRSDERSWQAVYCPRTRGWALSCSPSFANTVLPTTLFSVSWAACVTFCSFPLAMCSFLPPAFTGHLFLCELHSSPFFSIFTPQLLYLSLSTTPDLLLQHFQTFPWWSPVCHSTMSCSLFPASWLAAPVAGN